MHRWRIGGNVAKSTHEIVLDVFALLVVGVVVRHLVACNSLDVGARDIFCELVVQHPEKRAILALACCVEYGVPAIVQNVDQIVEKLAVVVGVDLGDE